MKKTFPFGERQIPGEEIEFETEREGFNIYVLHDGTKLKVKVVVTQVVRLDLHKPNGEPVYMVNSATVVAADVPESLMKRTEEEQ